MAHTPNQPAPSSSKNFHATSRQNDPKGSLAGLEELHSVHRRRLFRFFARNGASQDAADLVQESFVRLANSREKRPDLVIERPEAYLSTIALNLLRDRARDSEKRSISHHIAVDEVAIAGNDLMATLEARDQLRRIYASLGRLSPKTRSAFLAHHRDGLSYKQIASQEGVSLQAVQWRMSRAIADIRRAQQSE